MEKTQVHPSTKDEAFQKLGVVSAKNRKGLEGQVEFVRVRAGRQLLGRGSFAPTVLIGIAGTAIVSDADGQISELKAPFVVDSWATDDRRISQYTVVTEEPSTLLLVDWRYRKTVYSGIPTLTEISAHTSAEVDKASDEARDEVIDLTDVARSPQPVH